MAMTIQQLIGANVRRFREVKGLSQRRLAIKVKGNADWSGYLSGLEQGKQNCKLGMVEEIASALGVEVHELFIDRGEPLRAAAGRGRSTPLEEMEKRLGAQIDALENRVRQLEGQADGRKDT